VTAIETVLQVILQFMTPYINILLCCRAYCCCCCGGWVWCIV